MRPDTHEPERQDDGKPNPWRSSAVQQASHEMDDARGEADAAESAERLAFVRHSHLGTETTKRRLDAALSRRREAERAEAAAEERFCRVFADAEKAMGPG